MDGEFDSRMVWVLPCPIIRNKSITFYYSGLNGDHNGRVDPASPGGRPASQSGVSAARLRLDGFVAVATPLHLANGMRAQGELVTKPIIFDKGRVALELNVDAAAAGVLRVELLHANSGLPVDGYSLRDARPLVANSVAVRPQWEKPGSDVSKLHDVPLRLRFVMSGCKLYAFQFV